MKTITEQYVETINALPKGNIAQLLASVYSDNIIFTDPAHKIEGLQNLIDYFSKLYTNTSSCEFILHDTVSNDKKHALQWTMKLSHASLQKGKVISINGSSFLEYNNQDKIIVHQDYFDLGEMLYENIPVLNKLVSYVKGKL